MPLESGVKLPTDYSMTPKRAPESFLVMFFLSQAGNVVTGEMVEELILSGADIIKVGVGPGETCGDHSRADCGEQRPWGSGLLEGGYTGTIKYSLRGSRHIPLEDLIFPTKLLRCH